MKRPDIKVHGNQYGTYVKIGEKTGKELARAMGMDPSKWREACDHWVQEIFPKQLEEIIKNHESNI